MLIQIHDLSKYPGYAEKLKSEIRRTSGCCEICGFQSVRFMRLISTNCSSSKDLSFANLKLACPVCADAYDLLKASGKGRVIMLPELTQSELNAIVFASWSIKHVLHTESFEGHTEDTVARKNALGKNLEQLLGLILKARSQQVDKALGYSASEKFSASEPGEFGECLKAFGEDKINTVCSSQLYKSFRYFPLFDSYKNEFEFWKTSVFAKLNYSMLHEMSQSFYTALRDAKELRIN